MNKHLEQLYPKTPVFLQNIAVSLYGASLYQRRYMGDHDSYLEKLRVSQYFSKEQMVKLQLVELQKLLSHAFTFVPHYRDIAQAKGYTHKDFKDISDLSRIPILDLEQVRQFPETLHSEDPTIRGKFMLKTSGSSGKPISFLCDKKARQRHYAFWSRLREWFGIGKRSSRISFRWRLVASQKQKKPPFWRRDLIGNNYVFSVHHLSRENMDAYYRKIDSICPEEITGQPSSLYALAQYMKTNGLRWSRPPLLTISTAETLQPHIRKLIEDQFNSKIIDQYGCTEMALFVSECEEGTLHIHSEHGIVEVVDENDCPVPDGKPGEVVCTSFIGRAMPLIRYKLGDIVAVQNGECSCGRHFPIMESVLGRTDDMLVIPDGTRIAGIGSSFSNIPGLCEAQVIQTVPEQLTVKIVTDHNFDQKSEIRLLNQMRSRVGDEIGIVIDRVDGIPRESSGKFKGVISKLPVHEKAKYGWD